MFTLEEKIHLAALKAFQEKFETDLSFMDIAKRQREYEKAHGLKHLTIEEAMQILEESRPQGADLLTEPETTAMEDSMKWKTRKSKEKGLRAFEALREEASKQPEITLDEINEEIRLAREERMNAEGKEMVPSKTSMT